MLEVKQRILFEAIVIAADLIDVSMGVISAIMARGIARRAGEDIVFDAMERLQVMSAAWSVVDQTHNICSFIRASGNTSI